jgi:hypothetical protein
MQAKYPNERVIAVPFDVAEPIFDRSVQGNQHITGRLWHRGVDIGLIASFRVVID